MASFLKDTCRNDTFAARPGVRLCSPRINMWETTHINYFLRPSTNQFQFIKSELDSNHVWDYLRSWTPRDQKEKDRSSHEWRIPILTEARTHLNRNTRTRVSNIGNKLLFIILIAVGSLIETTNWYFHPYHQIWLHSQPASCYCFIGGQSLKNLYYIQSRLRQSQMLTSGHHVRVRIGPTPTL
jgi:hypothetical protein